MNSDGFNVDYYFDGSVAHIQKVLSTGIDVNHRRESDGATMIFVAVRLRNLEGVKYLISLGADVNYKYYENNITCLSVAISGSTIDVMEVLLENKADVNHVLKNGLSMLHLVSERVTLDAEKAMATALIKHGANVNAVDNMNRTPLHHLCMHQHDFATAPLFYEAGYVDVPDAIGCRAFDYVIHSQTKKPLVVSFIRWLKAKENMHFVMTVNHFLQEAYLPHELLVQVSKLALT